jgi:hypothetical protein
LRKWLCKEWPDPEVLPSDVLQRAPIRALRESPAARAAISVLVKHGWLMPLPEGTVVRGVARKEAYRIVGRRPFGTLSTSSTPHLRP